MRGRALGVVLLASLLGTLALGSCSANNVQPLNVQRFDSGAYPTQLSQWQLLRVSNGNLQRTAESLVYAINTPLFSDYTSKLRMISLPAGRRADYHPTETFNFPTGTIIAKTFYYDPSVVPLGEPTENTHLLFAGLQNDQAPKHSSLANIRLLETRLLVKQADGWDALPYVWNDEQTDASLKVGGALKKIGDAHYVVPSKAECASCHSTGATATNGILTQLSPIGPKARHLHHSGPGPSAMERLIVRDWLTGQPEDLATIDVNAQWQPALVPAVLDDHELERRTRSYLDANCGHCHSKNGSADTSQLMLDVGNHSDRQLGRCKPPIAAGKGTGGNLYALVPGKPDASIMIHRMASVDPSVMMPELGRTRAHELGVELVAQWIERMTGDCR